MGSKCLQILKGHLKLSQLKKVKWSQLLNKSLNPPVSFHGCRNTFPCFKKNIFPLPYCWLKGQHKQQGPLTKYRVLSPAKIKQIQKNILFSLMASVTIITERRGGKNISSPSSDFETEDVTGPNASKGISAQEGNRSSALV